MKLSDTIVAIATPPGRGGIGVVRISGSASWTVADKILLYSSGKRPAARVATRADLTDASGRVADHCLVTFFQAPQSYTAEDVVEVSCHGSPVVLQTCVQRAMESGARPAEPGEFTLRAYLNGRLDLPQAEAVRDLIESTTLYQARIAAQQAGGSVSRLVKPVKDQLLELIALLEAGIDFAEDDISVAPPEEILRRLTPIRDELSRLTRSFEYGKLVHTGFTLAIVGRPNVGKSSLFNRLLQQDRAIVTDIPGTTRDTVSESASICGLPVRFVDTAGIRTSSDVVESLGIERSLQAIADADLTLVVLDGSQGLTADDSKLIVKAQESGRYLLVANKSDRAKAAVPEAALWVSALTGDGIDVLRDQIAAAVTPGSGIPQEEGFITNARHERLLQESLAAIDKCKEAVPENIPHEMLLLDLYDALRGIDEISGATTADDILNRIFSTFCIGK